MVSRQEYNFKILSEIMHYVMNHPEIRFIQALWNVGIITRKNDTLEVEDKFYEEPDETLKRMKRVIYAKDETSEKSEKII